MLSRQVSALCHFSLTVYYNALESFQTSPGQPLALVEVTYRKKPLWNQKHFCLDVRMNICFLNIKDKSTKSKRDIFKISKLTNFQHYKNKKGPYRPDVS